VNLIDRIFEAPGRFGAAEVLLAVYAYTWQIYGDFSGYTDIARGSAKLLGFDLPENFDRPFQAHNLVAFWRRWHMTLTRWINDYLYVSLGGSRRGSLRTYVNIAITWLAIGLWHGASWNFVFFGAWHALGIMLYRFWRSRRPDARPATGWKFALGVIGTFHFHVFNWPFFRASTFGGALDIYREILFGDWGIWRIDPIVTWVVLGCFIVHFTPKRWVEVVRERFVAAPILAQAATASIAGVVIARVAASQPVPFIYFQF
ncbi:MAG: alginate O-acetyltransferase complex protein AlgI, partial [Myxococcota bacterium]